MIKLIFKILLLVFISLIVCNIIASYITKNENIMRAFISSRDRWSSYTYDAIKKSKTASSSKIAFIGDSVARQIIEGEKHDILDLSTNANVTMAGQYLIVNNIIKYQPNIKKIYLFVIPESLKIDINTKGIYNYFIKPFYSDEYKSELSCDTINIIMSKPYYIFYDMAISKVLPIFTLIDYSNTKMPINNNKFISKTAEYYLKRCKQICDNNGVEFVVLPCPMAMTRYNKFVKDGIKEKLFMDARQTGMYGLIGDYFNNIMVFDDKYFRTDDKCIHRKGESWPEVTNRVMSKFGIERYLK